MWELFHLLLCGKHVLLWLEGNSGTILKSLCSAFISAVTLLCRRLLSFLYIPITQVPELPAVSLYHLPQPQNPQQLAPCSFGLSPSPSVSSMSQPLGSPSQAQLLSIHPGLFLSGLSPFSPWGIHVCSSKGGLAPFFYTHPMTIKLT